MAQHSPRITTEKQSTANGDSLATTETERVLIVSPHVVRPLENQPRRYVGDDDPELEGLMASISEKGQIAPATVRVIHGDPTFRYGLIAGGRRREACIKLGVKLKILVIEVKDFVEALELAFVENTQRESLSPMDNARTFTILRKSPAYQGMAIGEFAERMAHLAGRNSKNWTYTYLRLMKLHPGVQIMLESNAPKTARLNVTVGRLLSRIKDKGEQLNLARQITEKRMTAGQAKALIQRTITSKSLPVSSAGKKTDRFAIISRFGGKMVQLISEIVGDGQAPLTTVVEGKSDKQLRDTLQDLDSAVAGLGKIQQAIRNALKPKK